MKIVPFEELYRTEFIITELFSKEQNWFSRGNVYSCLQKPKPSHTLLWFKNCSGKITDSTGNTLFVKKNQLTYTAKCTEYKIDFFNTAPDRADTLVIHFQLKDMQGNDIAPTLLPELCISDVDVSTALKLEKLAENFKRNVVCMPDAASVIYRIFASICTLKRTDSANDKYSCIKKGIELLESDTDMNIHDISRVCGVSECYFRKLFKEYSGETPMDFRQKHRIEKAKQLLLSDMLTIGEIAQELHFADIYHFSKTFKNTTGLSPSGYILKNRV